MKRALSFVLAVAIMLSALPYAGLIAAAQVGEESVVRLVRAKELVRDGEAGQITVELTFSAPVHIFRADCVLLYEELSADGSGGRSVAASSLTHAGGQTSGDGEVYSSTVQAFFEDIPDLFSAAGIRIMDCTGNGADGAADKWIAADLVRGFSSERLLAGEAADGGYSAWAALEPAEQPVQANNLTALEAVSALTLDSVAVLNQKQAILHFSGELNTDYNFQPSIVIVNNTTDCTVQTDGNTELRWKGYGIDGNYYTYGYPTTRYSFELADALTVGGNTVDSIADIFALTQTGGRFEGCQVLFCIEETDAVGSENYGNGQIDSIYTYNVPDAAGRAPFLSANKSSSGRPDAVYLPFSDANTDAIRLTQATLAGHEVTLTFSEPVHIFDTGFAFMVNTYAPSAENAGDFQYPVTNAAYTDAVTGADGREYATVVTLTVSDTAHFGDINSSLAKAGIRITDYGHYDADGLVSTDVISGMDGKAVKSNVTDGYSDTLWRRFDTSPDIILEKAVVVGEKELKLEFSSYVNTTFEFEPFIAVVDNAENAEVQVNNGARLVWSGAGKGNDNDYYTYGYPTMNWCFRLHDSVRVNGVPVQTIPDILALVAEGGAYAGCSVVFGIREMAGAEANGYVDTVYNINTDDAVMRSPYLRATKTVSGEADIAYVTIDASAYTGPDDSMVHLQSVTELNRGLWFFTLEFHFSEPVHIRKPEHIFYCNYGNNAGGSDLAGNYQLSVGGVTYVNSETDGVGTEYSDTVRILFWSGNSSAMEAFPHDGAVRVTDYGYAQDGAVSTDIVISRSGKALAAGWYDSGSDIEWCALTPNLQNAVRLEDVSINGFEATLTFSEPVRIQDEGCVWLTNTFAPDPNTPGDFQFQVRKITYVDAVIGDDGQEYASTIRVQFVNEASFGLSGFQYVCPSGTGVRIVDYGYDGNSIAGGNKEIDGYVNTAVISGISGSPVKATATDAHSDTCWREADAVNHGVRILSVETTDPQSMRVTVTFDREVHIFDPEQIFLCDRADPVPGVDGSYQAMISELNYIDARIYNDLAYASEIDFTFYTVPEQGLHSIMPGAGLRFVEYDYKDADDYTGTVSANVVADMQGVGLAANYNAVFQKPDTDGSGFWDWYRVDIAFHEIEMSGRLLTASPVNADTVRLVFDVPVQFKSGTMTLGNLYQAASAQMENGEDGYSRTWLVRFSGSDLPQPGLCVSVPVTAFQTDYGDSLVETARHAGYAVVSTDPWAGVVSPDDQIVSLTDRARYSFMNCDTGRVLSVGGTDEFTLVSAGSKNMYYIQSGGRYLDLTSSIATLSELPVYYMLREDAATRRFQIVVSGNFLIKDNDEGADSIPSLTLASGGESTVETGWYLTKSGENRPLRVLPLGDSITYGVGSTDSLGYRGALSEALGGYLGRVVFVGPHKTAETGLDSTVLTRHAGYPGYVVEDVWNVEQHPGVAPLLDGILEKYAPDVTLLMLGTNDLAVGMLSNGVTEEEWQRQMDRYANFIGKIEAAAGEDGCVIVSAVAPSASWQAYVNEYNRRLANAIGEMQEAGKKVAYSDNRGLSAADLDVDGVHLNDAGYMKFAAAWEASFKKIYNADGKKVGMTATPVYDDLILEHVYAYADRYFAIKFSDNIENDGVYWMDVRLYKEDAAGQLVTRPDGSVYQWHLACSYRNYPGDTLLARFDDASVTLSGIYRLAKSLGAQVRFCLQETDTDYPERVGTGYLEGFSASGDERRKLRTHTPGGWDTIYMETEPCDIPAVVSAAVLNETQIKVTFSRRVTLGEALRLSPYHNVNLTDPSAPETILYQSEWYNFLQWRGRWSGSSGNSLVFTIDQAPGGYDTFADIHDLTAPGEKFAGLQMTFAGVPIQYANPGDALEIESAEILNDSQIRVTFSDAVDISGSPFLSLRLVDGRNYLLWDGEEGSGTPMQWSGYWNYADESRRSIIWTLYYNDTLKTESLSDILHFTGAMSGWKGRDAHVAFSIEEAAGYGVSVTAENGFIENIRSVSGHKLKGNLIRPGWGDGVYIGLSGSLREQKLTVLSAQAVSDLEVLVTFSAPVSIAENTYIAMRLVDETDTLVWDGGEYGKGTPMQWGGKWEYCDADHTQILWTIYAQNTYGVSNLTDLLSYRNLGDFKEYSLKFCMEENLPGLIDSNGHVDTVCRADDEKIRLIADKKGGWEGIYRTLDIAYDSSYLTASPTILNDQQLRIDFSKPVEVKGEPFWAVRYLRDNRLVWSGEEEKSVPLQWTGTWEWADDSHCAVIWTMYGGNTYGADNLYDLLHYAGALEQYADARIVMCIEELGENGELIHAGNGLVDNIVSADGGTRLRGSYFYGLDGSFMPLEDTLHDKQPKVVSATAVDDRTLEVVFSEPVVFAEGELAPAVGIRYLTESGDTNVFSDGRFAVFDGAWTFDESDPCKMLWRPAIPSHGAESLTDILNYEGDLLAFRGMRVAFCINDPEHDSLNQFTGNVMTVTSEDGLMHLHGTQEKKHGVSQTDITVAYALPAASYAITDGQPGQFAETYIPLWAWISAGAMVVLGAGIGICPGRRGRKQR